MNKLTLSLLIVSLCAAAALARTAPQIRRPFRFTPGQTYIYEYSGRQLNGLATLADQYSGLELDCDVILRVPSESQGREVVMKLDDIKIEQIHTQTLNTDDIRKLNEGKEQNMRQIAMFKNELAKPVRFQYVDGKVISFVAESSDAEWSVNIKKSILSLFQLDLAPTKIIKSSKRIMSEQLTGVQAEDMILSATEMPLVYPIYEESFGGICETLYQVDSIDNMHMSQQQDFVEQSDVLNVTKTVNYKNCLTDPSVSYDRHSFKVNTQTIKGRLFSQDPQQQLNYYPVPEAIKSKSSNGYTATDMDDQVAAPAPVERHSYTKYNISTAPQYLADKSADQDMMLIEGVFSEGKIKYEADGDVLISDTQQQLRLISVMPTNVNSRVAPELAELAKVDVQQPVEYSTIQCELNTQKLKFYQAMWNYARAQQMMKQQQQGVDGKTARDQLYSHQLALPFALSASWYPIVATGLESAEQQHSLEQTLNPEQLAKSYENLLVSLADDIVAEDVADSKKVGEKVVRMVNVVAFMPKYKLAEIHDRIVERIQQSKEAQKQQSSSTLKAQLVDSDETAKWKVVRKLFIDSLPLAGSKQAIEMIEFLIETNRVRPFEANELCQAVPANLRYPDTEIIDAFIRISQLPQVRKNRGLFASCSIAVGKMISTAYIKSKDASYRPTSYEPITKLPTHLRDDELVRQVVEEADPRRQLPIDWNSQELQQVYQRLVLDEQDLIKYVKLYKQLLTKTNQYHEKVIFIETLAHMKVPQVLPVLEPFVSGRLSLGQCLGNQPFDSQSSQLYQQQQQQQLINNKQISANNKDWSPEDSYAAEECNYMRTIAIYALAHVARVAPSKVQAMLLPVFDNTLEPYQVRVAAFTSMMINPIEGHILERIASQMWREPSKEVASFVVGSIDTMSKLNSPSLQAFKFAALKAHDSMPKQYLDTWKFSSVAGGDHFNKQRETGSAWLAEIVKSNVSSIPRGAYMHLGRFHGPAGAKFDNVIELGFTSKGLESLLKDYIQYNRQQEQQTDETNIIASIVENLYDSSDDLVAYYRSAKQTLRESMMSPSATKTFAGQHAELLGSSFFKRQQPIEGVNSAEGKQSRKLSDLFEASTNSRSKRSVTIQAKQAASNGRLGAQDSDEEPKLTLFSKLFDSTSYHALDKRQIVAALEKADDYVKMIAQELVAGSKLHYVKLMMPVNMWHMVPSQMGLPVVVTHRTPIVASVKIDASNNGQLTSTKISQAYRQQVTGDKIPNVVGHNFASKQALNITALVHPKIMHSSVRFLFAVEQANGEAFGVQTEKSHQISLPLELSVAYSQPKQLVSIAIEPKTPTRSIWTKEVAKTFIGPVALSTSQADSWLGREHIIRVASKTAQASKAGATKKATPEAAPIGSIIGGIQSLVSKPKEQLAEAIEDLETPFKFAQNFVQQTLGLEFQLEGVTDDEDIVSAVERPELAHLVGQSQWTSTEDVDELDQHTKSGPLSEYLHMLDSAINRPSKYLEFYATLKPQRQQTKSPVYRFNFVLNGKQQPVATNTKTAEFHQRGRLVSRLDAQMPEVYAALKQSERFNKQQQPIAIEVY